jgi:hypothetical protein
MNIEVACANGFRPFAKTKGHIKTLSIIKGLLYSRTRFKP